MKELERLEKQGNFMMMHLEVNSKKIRQRKLKDHTWDLKRLDANLRIINELREVAEMINELGNMRKFLRSE